MRPLTRYCDYPVILVAAEPLASLYRSVSASCLTADTVFTNPDSLSVIDEIAKRVLDNSGRVLAVRAQDMIGDTGVAAILRYPLHAWAPYRRGNAKPPLSAEAFFMFGPAFDCGFSPQVLGSRLINGLSIVPVVRPLSGSRGSSPGGAWGRAPNLLNGF